MIDGASTIPAVDTAAGEVAWTPGSSYALNDERASDGGIYTCVKAHSGVSTLPAKDPTRWLYQRPTNRMAPFDEYLYTKAEKAGTITYVINPGFINGVAAHGLEADEYEFTYRESPGGAVLLHESGDLHDQALGLYEYLYTPLPLQSKWSSPVLPMRPLAQVEITFRRIDGASPVAVGWIGLGRWHRFAAPGSEHSATQYGVNVTPKTYAYFKRNDDGTYKRLPGRSAKQIDGTAIIAASDAPEAEALLRAVVDKPVLIDLSPLPRYGYLSTLGFLSGTVTAEHWSQARIDFRIEGNI